MILFKILWGINALAALVIIYFFITGLRDGSVTYRNIKLWLLILLVTGCVLWGSILLQQQGYQKASILLSLVLAIPSAGYGLFVLLAIFSNNKWN